MSLICHCVDLQTLFDNSNDAYLVTRQFVGMYEISLFPTESVLLDESFVEEVCRMA